MRWLAIGCALLGFVACGSLPPFNPTNGAGSSGGTTGSQTTSGSSSAAASSTSASGSATGAASSSGSTIGPATSSGGTSTGGQGSSTGGNGTTSGSYIGLPCTFDAQTDTDSCVPYGYVCGTEYNSANPAVCGLPLEQSVCQANVGCQDGGTPELVCTPGFTTPQNKAVSVCTYPCKAIGDCQMSYETCATEVGGCVNVYCTNYYGACQMNDGGPAGQCLPFGSGANEFGLCFQTGFDFVGNGCNSPLGRVGAYSQCQAGGLCLADWQTVAGTGDGGECVTITSDGSCPPGEDLLALTGVPWQACLPDCTTALCAAGSVCLNDTATNEQMCFPSSNGTN